MSSRWNEVVVAGEYTRLVLWVFNGTTNQVFEVYEFGASSLAMLKGYALDARRRGYQPDQSVADEYAGRGRYATKWDRAQRALTEVQP